MPERDYSKSNYGPLSRLLHKLALDYSFVAEALFDIERAAASGAPPREINKPVFIVGLARSGTTALLTSLYETGGFRSLTYRDMPFVLMPSVWKKLSGTRAIGREKTERAHGDGILVNAESPEAFEEIFWRTFCGDSYIHADCLTPHKVDRETLQKFRRFVGSVVSSADDPRQARYLSKNNNNLLRLPALRQAFPDAVIIVPFRDPVQQSISLMSQHRRFCQRHAQDPFSLQYMNWLAHHEFGRGHKPFRFDGTGQSGQAHAAEDIDYWLSCWNDSYRYILRTADTNTYFLCFEKLCEESSAEIARLRAVTGIPADANFAPSAFVLPPMKTAVDANPDLNALCNDTYREMVQRNNRGQGAQ